MTPQKILRENKIVSIYGTILLLTVLALWFINALNIAYPLSISTKNVSGELAVVGEGQVEIVPNLATTDLGITVTNAKTVTEAQNQINEVNNKIVASVTSIGVKKEDIKTSNYSIAPNYDYQKNPAGTIVGYNGNVTVTVKVRDTAKLPQVLEAATKAGANQIINTSYSVEKPEVYREQAREKAIQNAREQAEKLATSLGIRLGKIVNIVETTNTPGPIMPYAAKAQELSMNAGGGIAPDLQSGTQTISSTVTLYFEKR